ncbi:bem46 protein, variant [Savitreella phatthalungensis]
MDIIKYSLGTALVLSVAAASGLYAFQLSLIYPSSLMDSRSIVDIPPDHGIDLWEEIWLDSLDGERLHCYLMRSAQAKATVIFYHANAGNMGHRLPIARALLQMDVNVFMLSYRGYGRSTGYAEEKGIRLDAQAAVDYILGIDDLRCMPMYAFGQSIGGAVAVAIVHRNPGRFAGLIIENTFTSLRDLIPSVLPLATYLAWLCHQKWDTRAIIKAIDCPILFLSGGKDELVPPAHMKALYELAQDKEWHLFRWGSHNDTICQPGYMAAVAAFIKRTHTSDRVKSTESRL